MATGYAVMIVNGASFEEFVMKCGVVAGAHLALNATPVEQNSPGRELVAAELRALQAQLDVIEAMSDEAIEAACEADHALECLDWQEAIASRGAKRAKYAAMLEQLRVWPAPGTFEALKADMIRQVEASIASDCDANLERAPVRLSPTEWRVQQITEKQSAIEHLTRTAARYAWMHELRASLGLSADASAPL